MFVIALSTPSYASAFGHGSPARYLNDDLRPKGTLLSGYTTLGGAELPDYLAMIGGQAPNPDTRANCPSYDEFPSSAKPNKSGEVPGTGCIYPNTALTIGDQVTASGHVWKAYIDDMGATACVHPNSNALDNAPLPGTGTDYDTRHNPFIYFHSLLDLGDCASDDVTLAKLPAALASASKTPAYAFITPGECEDAAQTSCPDGSPAGLAGEDTFLKTWVPKILHAPAFRKDGALIIVFAHASPAPATGGPDATDPAGPARTGALVISPYARRDRTVSKAYNPYSLLRSVEDMLGLQLLAHAKHAAVVRFRRAAGRVAARYSPAGNGASRTAPSISKHRSRALTTGPGRAPARAFLKGIGYDDEAMSKPIVAVANTWIETMPCNFHLRALAAKVKEGIREAGGTPMELNTIAISDGITMGTLGMRASLVSREVIADSIELVGNAHLFDAVIAISGCDKTIPATVMALCRLNIPSLMLYGGSILPGHFHGETVTIQEVFEAVRRATPRARSPIGN